MARWILKRAGRNSTPIGHIKMVELAKLGRLMPTDLVALEGSDNWVAGDKFSELMGRQQAPGKQTLLDLPTVPVTPLVNLSELAEDELTAGLPMDGPFQDEIKKKEIARRWLWKKIGIGTGGLVLIVLFVLLTRYAIQRHEAAGYAAQSRENLNDIGTALHLYAENYDDLYPHSLGVLVKEKLLSPRQLLNPATRHAAPITFELETLARWADHDADYGFIASDAPPAGLDPKAVVVYELWEEAADKPIQVLTAEGLVSQMEASEAEALIQASRSHAWRTAQAAKTRATFSSPGSRPTSPSPPP